jgi:hypothetical protein
LLALAGILAAFFILKRRKRAPFLEEEPETECGDEGYGDSTTFSDEIFVSEYGFSAGHVHESDSSSSRDAENSNDGILVSEYCDPENSLDEDVIGSDAGFGDPDSGMDASSDPEDEIVEGSGYTDNPE